MKKDKPIIHRLFYALLWVAAILLPLIIWRLDLPIVQSTFNSNTPSPLIESQPFELFGFFSTTILVVTTWIKVGKQPRKKLVTLVPIVLPLLIFLNLLFIQIETFQVKSSDYMCYENAAKAILGGSNPYIGNPSCYLYPPLLAQILSYLYQVANLFTFTDKENAWTAVTYLYQCIQFFQIILAYYLTLLLALDLKVKALPASVLVSIVFIFNYPLVRTITFDQVNLWLLNSFLLGIILLRRYPLLGGAAVALGSHIKIYTLILLIPWGFTRKWKAIIGLALGIVSIFIIQTNFFQDWTVWQYFFSYFRSPEKPTNYRNNAIFSLVFNFAKIPSELLNTNVLSNFVPIIVIGLSFFIFVWFILRFVQREQIYSKLAKSFNNNESNSLNYVFRLYGHSIDMIALSLLISPSVWEHHYVFAIPVAVWTIITRKFDKPLLISVGIFLIFCPSLEIFPLSFHRLAGLLILVYLSTPIATQGYFTFKLKQINHILKE